MKKVIVNICLIIATLALIMMFILWMYDLISMQLTVDEPLHPYFERFLSFSLVSLIGAVGCIIALVLINKGEGEVFKMSMKEGLAKWREKKAEKKLQKDNTQKQARIAELEQELNELKKDE